MGHLLDRQAVAMQATDEELAMCLEQCADFLNIIKRRHGLYTDPAIDTCEEAARRIRSIIRVYAV